MTSAETEHHELIFTPYEIARTRLIILGTKLLEDPNDERQLVKALLGDHNIDDLSKLPQYKVFSIAAALDYDSRCRGLKTDFLAWATDQLDMPDTTS